ILDPHLAKGLSILKPHLAKGLYILDPHLAKGLSILDPHLAKGLSILKPHLAKGLSILKPHLAKGLSTLDPHLDKGLYILDPHVAKGLLQHPHPSKGPLLNTIWPKDSYIPDTYRRLLTSRIKEEGGGVSYCGVNWINVELCGVMWSSRITSITAALADMLGPEVQVSEPLAEHLIRYDEPSTRFNSLGGAWLNPKVAPGRTLKWRLVEP
ncbi:uncharacterized protein LOC119588808, partial [Penaeus monodon]|uniref:uncharacterized protein LOC119588808 n=1 Tax=Penaeus monodon TaxID=6687 RepID=UPI0018A768E1